MSYITKAWRSIVLVETGEDVSLWTMAAVLMCILIPIAWVRNISKFSFTFLIGNLLIMTTVIVVSISFFLRLVENDFKFGKGIVAINGNEYWGMVGFSVYAYEGIGVVMPIMEKCECPERFDRILMAGIGTLTVVYICFADFSYLVVGTDIDKPFITEELPQSSFLVVCLQLIYSLNLICSYPIMIYPANEIIENYLLSGVVSKDSKGPRRER